MNRQFLSDRPIPTGWQSLTVDEIKASEKHSCVAGPFGSSISSKYFVAEGIPVIRGSNLRDDLTPFVPYGFVFVSPEQAKRYKGQHVKAGDLVFTCWGTLGQVGLIPQSGPFKEYIISNKQLKLRPNPDLADSRFLFYYFGSPQMVHHIRSIAIGAAVPGINLGLLKGLRVTLPPLPIQRRIVEILSTYDDLIENNNRRIKILNEIAQIVYREWFVCFRFPGHEKVNLIDSELGPVPEGFAAEPLESVCRKITDGSHWSPKSVDEGLPMASVKDMHDWGLNLSSCRKVSQDDFDTLIRNDCKPLVGDVLIAKDGSYLKHCFWMQKENDVVILSSIAILRPNERIASSYLSLHLLDPQIKSRMAGYVSGVAVPRIVLKDFRRFNILRPPTTVQLAFSKVVEPMLQLCWCLTEKNAVLRRTRDFLLPKLISDEIPVEAAEETAIEAEMTTA
jgi:type I restriction enzyme S subunit